MITKYMPAILYSKNYISEQSFIVATHSLFMGNMDTNGAVVEEKMTYI